MHNNYYFLRQLSASLEQVLAATVISECFSQQKDELIVRFETHKGSFYIKGSVHPNFSCLSFPEDFQRARKNSVDLFDKAIGQRVTGVKQFRNERSFAITLSNGFAILFKMHGNRANIILFEHDTVSNLFRNNIGADHTLKLTAIDRDIDWSFEQFEKHSHNLQALYFTFGKRVWQYLEATGFQGLGVRDQWRATEAVRIQLESPLFYITADGGGMPVLSLLKTGQVINTCPDALAASNDFYYAYTHAWARQQQKTSLLATLRARLQGSTTYQQKNAAKLEELQRDNNYKIWADLIMANLHAIEPNTERITVENFYNHNLPLEIRLRRELTPQKNAAVYYRKSKNQQIEIDRLEQTLRAKAEEIALITARMEEITAAEDLKTIRKLQAELSQEPDTKKQEPPLPYHEFILNGFRIWVGKNAQSNDVLTQKLGYKEDLWLHAKDVAGSHVLIKHQAGKKFPKDVIERAAQLAAYNSKRKTESLCPVIVTPRKFVRKRKGDPPGAVVVEREEVIMVEPKL